MKGAVVSSRPPSSTISPDDQMAKVRGIGEVRIDQMGPTCQHRLVGDACGSAR
jgi:hypothetical protein